MAVPLESVVKQLADSGIVAPGKLENFVPPKANPTSVEELVANLVKQSHLTPFQATQVKAGKVRALILGSYTILDRIGAGGMGQVFKAQHRRMKRLVAIKMLPAAMTKDAAALARFEREVEAAAKLLHPNIVSAFDADQAGNVHFLVMEYVDGKDLSATVKQNGPLPVNEAVNYLLQVARGLEYAHSQGVIHRDIKPANLLLGGDRVVKILDMGLARVAGSAESGQMELTGSGMIMGTVDFMSPEQAIATKHADHRADIYSLGISLYYLLSGRMPYSGDTAIEKLMAHQTQPIPNLQDVQTTVPKQLDAIFQKMAAKKADDRYQSMTEVIEDLEGLRIGTTSTKKEQVATTLALSPEQKKKLAAEAKKKPRMAVADSAASEQTRNLILKIVGGTFGTIIAPILVFYLIRYLEKREEAAKPPVATATETPASSSPPSPLAGEGPVVSGPDGTRRVPTTLVAPFDAAQAKAGQAAWAKYLGTQVETTNKVDMPMALIPPGEFLMGSTDEQIEAALKIAEEIKADQSTKDRIQKYERPQRPVTITKPFLLGVTLVTLGQFRKFVDATKYVTEAEQNGSGNSDTTKTTNIRNEMTWQAPGYPASDDFPVTQISWNDEAAFCNWASESEGHQPAYRRDGGTWTAAAAASGYRLPTEAEWEYACRAGTITQYSFGDDWRNLEEFGWFKQNSGGQPRPVASKGANPFGLYDMHGQLWESCQDYWSEAGHGKFSVTDPQGPGISSAHALRGGSWYGNALLCRSACRHNIPTVGRSMYYGFRVARTFADTRPESSREGAAPPLSLATDRPPPAPANGASAKVRPWDTPAFQQWVKATQALPADKQIEAVSKKLIELNPGFDGKILGRGDWAPSGAPKVEKGVVTEIGLPANNVTDISPVRAFVGLKSLTLNSLSGGNRSALSDLSPLQGMSLTELRCRLIAKVADLSPLHGMPLGFLDIYGTQVSDLSPLRGMPLTRLDCYDAPITDLSPLQETRLTTLSCGGSKLSSISPLKGMPLTKLECSNSPLSDLSPLERSQSLKFVIARRTKVTSASVAALQKALPDCKIEWDGPAKTVGGDANKPWESPAFQQWVKATQALTADQQIEAVGKKLIELNPAFDGKLTGIESAPQPKVVNGIVTEFGFFSNEVTDISPVRAFAGLKALGVSGGAGVMGKLTDLSPLSGMQLTYFSCSATRVADLSPLRGMPLERLSCHVTPVANLSPVAGMPLRTMNISNTPIADLSPLAGMKLTGLHCGGTKVSDISVLRGMPIVQIHGLGQNVSDISPLADCPSLKLLYLNGTKVTQAGIAALQTALPNCTIEWNDAAKTKLLNDPGQPLSANKPWEMPAFQQWVKETQALLAQQQIEAVSRKLMELNPGFDGAMRGRNAFSPPKIENRIVTEIGFLVENVTDISPVRALTGLKALSMSGGGTAKGKLADLSPLDGMRLERLECCYARVANLSPVRGMPLTFLDCQSNPELSDLSPLRGMSLTELNFQGTRVSGLSPLAGMKLTSAVFHYTQVSDLSPLRGMPLATLICEHTPVADLSPLEACKSLTSLKLRSTHVTAAGVATLQRILPNCKIEWDEPEKAPSPPAPLRQGSREQKKLAYLDPIFQQWVKQTQALPAENQGDEIKKKLVEWNPGFDSYCNSTIEGGMLTRLEFVVDDITDISPVRALPGLKDLLCAATTNWQSKLSGLSPLRGMKLSRLKFSAIRVANLSPLRGMPLTDLKIEGSPVTDLSPLAGSSLRHLRCDMTKISDLAPMKGIPLAELSVNFTPVADLSPLQGMTLTKSFSCAGKR